MGLDIGDKRIGVALSDPSGILATPFTIIECESPEKDLEAIAHIVSHKEVGIIIVGLPRSMDGEIRGQALKVQGFVKQLLHYVDIPVEFRDERLTSVTAKRLMQGSRKKTRNKVRYDAAAAAVILQSYLEEGR
ncbi:MAG TPA: Holliday junction resolvase RuvX [Dehalococcoidia bacterium]|nr:Holliday junction resolvase RuvX [Dehalococcoidia bacterium]